MSRWRQVRKIDAHTHVVLHERKNTDLVLNPPDAVLRTMDAHNVERAVVLPINHADYYPLDEGQRADWLRSNNDIQADLMRDSGGRFVSFADCRIDGPYAQAEAAAEEARRAIGELGLRGVKIHPYNLNVEAFDPRLAPVIDVGERRHVPIVFHANPSSGAAAFHGSAPSRVYRAMLGKGECFAIAHLGGVSFLETLAGGGYVDVSGTLPWLADLYGVPFCERLLRRIGVDRVLFATDAPVHPYESYYEVLDTMDLADDEIEKIGYANAERMLSGLPPVDPTA
jgi:predicted TIM-barrel fold metal-dependent hydrolase